MIVKDRSWGFVVHPLLHKIPMRLNFLYTVISGFDFPHAKFISDSIYCVPSFSDAEFSVTVNYNFEEVFSLCAPMRCHQRLLFLCANELTAWQWEVERFVTRFEKYYNMEHGLATRCLTHLPSLRILALSTVLTYCDFSIQGFKNRFDIDLMDHLTSSEINSIWSYALQK